MMVKLSLILLSILLTTGCASQKEITTPSITLPMIGGWYNNTRVYYITTDISDKALAKAMGANYVPRLEDAIPPYPKPPTLKTVLERVYVFPGKEQGSILASAPQPVGPESTDRHYSPLWILYEVEWLQKDKQARITNEESLLAAEEKGLLKLTRTRKIVNCPIVMTEGGQSLGVGSLPDGTTNVW